MHSVTRNAACNRACEATGTLPGFENCFGSCDNETETLTSSLFFKKNDKAASYTVAVVVNLFHPQTIIQPVVDALGSKHCLNHP